MNTQQNQKVLEFPQIQSIASVNLRENIERALNFLDEENVDVGLFLLSKEFEATLKICLIVAQSKGILQTTPGPDPDKWLLANMVDCATKHRIITDKGVVQYLRQERNNRSHGSMPSQAERKILMENINYLAGLYIGYIEMLEKRLDTYK
ncbi:MAG: hypothetical protein ACJ795_07205 [Ktedonobacteraceae bacterium]